MSARVLGVGLGVFIVFLLWTTALFVCFILWRSKGAASLAGFGLSAVALLITIILILIPKAPETPQTTSETKIFDEMYIGRIILVIILGVCALTSSVLIVLNHWMKATYVTPVKYVK